MRWHCCPWWELFKYISFMHHYAHIYVHYCKLRCTDGCSKCANFNQKFLIIPIELWFTVNCACYCSSVFCVGKNENSTLQSILNPKVLGQVLSQPKSYPIPPPPYSVLSLSYNRWFSEASNFLLQKVYDCTYARKAEKKKEIFALHLQVRLIDSDKRQKPQLMVVHQWLEHGAVQIRGGPLGGQVPGPLSLPAGEADGRGQVSGGHPRDQAGGDSPHRLRNHPR